MMCRRDSQIVLKLWFNDTRTSTSKCILAVAATVCYHQRHGRSVFCSNLHSDGVAHSLCRQPLGCMFVGGIRLPMVGGRISC